VADVPQLRDQVRDLIARELERMAGITPGSTP